jgi:TRAP-type C4-dicarboxylate transport system permease small subunit
LRRIAEKLAVALAAAGVGSLMLTILVVIADISTRKSLGYSIKGTIDLTQLAQMACVFLALPYVFLKESHISVDFVTDRLPARWRALARAAAELVTLGLMLAITWYSFAQAAIQIDQGDRSVTLGIPILAYWVPALTGLTLSCVAVTLVLLGRFRKTGSVPK